MDRKMLTLAPPLRTVYRRAELYTANLDIEPPRLAPLKDPDEYGLCWEFRFCNGENWCKLVGGYLSYFVPSIQWNREEPDRISMKKPESVIQIKIV